MVCAAPVCHGALRPEAPCEASYTGKICDYQRKFFQSIAWLSMIPSWPTAGFTVTDFHFWNERYLYHERFDFYVIMPGSCKFKLQWFGKDKYKEWLLQGKDVRHAKCRVCQSQFDISSMGEAALTSHAKGQKHQHQLQSFRQTQRTNMTMSSFCRPSTSAAESESSQSSSAACMYYIYCFFHVVEEKHFLIMSRKLLSSIIICEL